MNMNTEAIRAKFDKWWESTGKTDLVSCTSGFASSNRLTINHREMAFEAYMQAVKDMEANMIGDCGCHFESDEGNSVILCEKCSNMPAHDPSWISVKHRVPDDESIIGHVEVFTKDGIITEASYADNYGLFSIQSVTHWRLKS